MPEELSVQELEIYAQLQRAERFKRIEERLNELEAKVHLLDIKISKQEGF